MQRLILAFFAIAIFFLPVQAHRVNIFAYVEGDQIHVECGFSRTQKVRQGKIEVYDSVSKKKILEGSTDNEGLFFFPVSQEMKDSKHDLVIRILAGEGHQNEWVLPSIEIDSATIFKPQVPKISTTTLSDTPEIPVSVNQESVTKSDVELIVNEALDVKLAPVKQMLAENLTSDPTFKDIVGGLGWILGLIGIAAYCKRK